MNTIQHNLLIRITCTNLIYLKESKWDSPHPFGAIGIGEITGAPGIPAVYMAIENAIGRQCLDQYPATPDVILKALGKN